MCNINRIRTNSLNNMDFLHLLNFIFGVGGEDTQE